MRNHEKMIEHLLRTAELHEQSYLEILTKGRCSNYGCELFGDMHLRAAETFREQAENLKKDMEWMEGK